MNCEQELSCSDLISVYVFIKWPTSHFYGLFLFICLVCLVFILLVVSHLEEVLEKHHKNSLNKIIQPEY